MSGIPHPLIVHSMNRFSALPPEEKAKVRFIHLNHTNPALWPDSEARATIIENGFGVAEEGERIDL
jgi:pyrroloquinoline quinone biosynthesis protein B